jgi:hypothetical protein
VRYQPQRAAAFFLLVILGGNFFFSAFWPDWQATLPHDHIFLGPVYSGWERHHQALNYSTPYRQLRSQPLSPLESEQAAFVNADAALRSKVISLYRSPAGDDTLLSVAVQLLWLAEWPLLFRIPSLAWSIAPTPLTLVSALLPPPDKPPSIHLS